MCASRVPRRRRGKWLRRRAARTSSLTDEVRAASHPLYPFNPSESYRAHAATSEVVEGLVNLGLGVHDEGAVARDGLAERPAAEEQHVQIFARVGRIRDANLFAVGVEENQLPVAPGARLRPEAPLAVYDVGEDVKAFGHGLSDAPAGLDGEVQVEDWRPGFDDRARAQSLARDDAD